MELSAEEKDREFQSVIRETVPTPAARLTHYHAPRFPGWRMQASTVQRLNDSFTERDLNALWDLVTTMGSGNPLAACVAHELYLELKRQENLEERGTYQIPWWLVTGTGLKENYCRMADEQSGQGS